MDNSKSASDMLVYAFILLKLQLKSLEAIDTEVQLKLNLNS